MVEMSAEHIAMARANLRKAWEETQEFAKRNNLGEFLNSPLELNQRLMAMVSLMNKIQFAEQRHKYETDKFCKEEVSCYVRKYAQGKFDLSFTKNGKYDEKAKNAFSGAVDVYAILKHDEFISSMRRQDVPEEIIMRYLKGYCIIDECYGSERNLY